MTATPEGQKTRNDLIAALIKDPQEKLTAANKAKKDDEALKSTNDVELAKINAKILDCQNELTKELANVKNAFDRLNTLGAGASELATTVSAPDVATSITDAAKSIKAVLDAMETTYPEAMAMEARVQSVDVIDSAETKKLVAAYTKSTMEATEMVEKWKNTSVDLALKYSSFLKKDVDGKLAKMADLTAAIEVLGKDVDDTIASKEADLKKNKSAAMAVKTKNDELDLDILKNDLAIVTNSNFVDLMTL